MKILTFPGGIHPPYNKDISIGEALRTAPPPETAIVPLSQHIGAPCRPAVTKGDEVSEGQVIGESPSFVSSLVHSPVSGKVQDIKKAFHPALGYTEAVFIERDPGKEPLKYTSCDSEDLTQKELIEKVKKAGIVGMGGAAFPTHVKLSVPEGKNIENLIINGAECEPYLTCDHILMTRKSAEIIKGIEILIRVLEPKNTYIAIEDNKKAAIFAFEKLIRESTRKEISAARVVPLETKYPQGGEKQLIKAISGKEVPPGGLPLDIGFLVQNVGTALAIHEAVEYDKPLIERVVTLSGDCLERPGNYHMRIGTTVKEIVEKLGIEFRQDPKKIIFGGPMMGIAQPGTEVPVLKNTSGILFLSESTAKDLEEKPCIRCAKCVDVCPVNLMPTEIMRNVKARRWEEAEALNVQDCMECGCCTYTCPARIPLVQYIKEGKTALLKKRK
ncbi:MAG: electron transport complex subunit RsxC [Candidatus Omnitrophica bacterium]|nr:electron transport complex subunit RsxC [Candidatus Omnitrophota bacterium]